MVALNYMAHPESVEITTPLPGTNTVDTEIIHLFEPVEILPSTESSNATNFLDNRRSAVRTDSGFESDSGFDTEPEEPEVTLSDSFNEDLLHEYADEELIKYINAAPQIHKQTTVSVLSKNFLTKTSTRSEVADAKAAMELAQTLGIRVPRILRVVHESNLNCHYIMERIEGITLEKAWSGLGWFKTAKLAWKLRSLVRRMRSVTSPTAGGVKTGECRSYFLDDHFGLPENSKPEDIAYFLKFWTEFDTSQMMTPKNPASSADAKRRFSPKVDKLVFTHHDLALRNIMLDPSGQLWLIDWDYAGFYPTFFEYTAMQNFDVPENWGFFQRLRWNLFTRVTVGRHEKEREVLETSKSRFTRFAFGRRLALRKYGGPSKFPVE